MKPDTEKRLAAEPKYSVIVTLCIGSYVGEWTGKEPKMEEQSTILCQSPSKKYAELMYKRIVGNTAYREGRE